MMVSRAARWARRRGRRSLTVAVDAANPYAKRIYDELGFRWTHRRLAYILLGAPGDTGKQRSSGAKRL